MLPLELHHRVDESIHSGGLNWRSALAVTGETGERWSAAARPVREKRRGPAIGCRGKESIAARRTTETAMRVLVAGCGYVGSALAGALVAEGHEVWGMRRTPARLPPGVRAFPADLRDPATLADLPRALDVVAYTATADESTDEAYRAAYVDGPRHLLSALWEQEQRPRRVLFTSSTSVYGQREGEWVDEDSRTDPGGFSGARMLEGERVFLDGPFPATVLRLGGIYGPGRTSLVEKVRSGDAVCTPEPGWTNRIHRDDAAGALRHLAMLDAPASCYLGVDREPAALCDVYRWIATRLGLPAPPVRPGAAGGRRRSPGNKRCRSDRLAASGYAFRYPTFREGFGTLLEA
jgi:nucleoside-diphosphate-sugar epimerase